MFLFLCGAGREASGQTNGRFYADKSVKVINLIVCLLAVHLLIQCSETKGAEIESQEGKPCICNSTFYRHCPKKNECLEDIVLDPLPESAEPRSISWKTNRLPYHDDLDPDHVDISPPFGSIYDALDRNFSPANGEEPIVRHRKVYLSSKGMDKQPKIHSFHIRIPVSVPTLEPANIPEPKPIFKLKKYTTYESKPELQMVPITKTFIRPIGVSPDQIIDEEGLAKKG